MPIPARVALNGERLDNPGRLSMWGSSWCAASL